MKWPTLICPLCEGVLRNTDVYPGRPVVCPTCGAKLQLPVRRGRLEALIGLCITLAICYVLGLSPAWFAAATVLLWFPIFVTWGFILGRIVPPRFEAYKPQDSCESKFLSLGLSGQSSRRTKGHPRRER
jgi:hypothetical protein